MNREQLLGLTVPRPVARVVAFVAAAGVFACLASVIGPFGSSAAPERGSPKQPGFTTAARRNATPPVTTDVAAAPQQNSRGGSLLGELVGAEHRVWIYSSQDGPLYTVCTATGKILAEDLPADEVYRAFPELNIENMLLEPSGDGATDTTRPVALMSAEG